MDIKRLILSVTLTLGLLLGYQLLMLHLQKVHPTWFDPKPAIADESSAPPATNPTTMAAVTTPTTGPSPSPMATTVPVMPVSPATPGGYHIADAPAVTPTQLGSDSPASNYHMLLTIDPTGAGVDSAVLGDFYDTAKHEVKYKFQSPINGFESLTRPMATRTISIDGKDIDLSSTVWQLVSSTTDSAVYKTVILNGAVPAVELTKTFKLLKNDSPEGSGWEVHLEQGFRNLSPAALKIAVAFNGPRPPARENDRSEDRRYVTGYDNGYKEVETGSAAVSDFDKGKPTKDLIATDSRPTVWIGACSSYFESIFQPVYTGKPAIKLVNAIVAPIDPGTATLPEKDEHYPTQLQIVTNEFTLPAGAADTLASHVFFGPKERSLLKDDYYSAFPRMYYTTLLYISGPCGYITFTWLINTLYFILWCFHAVFRDWGVAIICLVALVRTLLHPITKRSQINMMEMSKKGPELERLKKKFADDKEALLKAQAELMNPAGMLLGCLPMFLQTPIWIALWSALQSTFELRQAGFLRHGGVHLTWIADLSHPDALYTFASPIVIPIIFTTIKLTSINILPMFLAVVFFIQQQLQPVPPNMTPEQEQQRKMMKWMSLLFPVMLYSGPSGLTLYIMTSTTIGIIENKIIRDHIKQREEAEKAGRIIVDAAPTRASKRRDDDGPGSLSKRGKTPPKPAGGLGGWWADLQEKVEQAKREAERRGSK
jgi:YidC/Oxa1 family membrane protein insertase